LLHTDATDHRKISGALGKSVDARKLNHNLTVAFEVAGARTSIVLAERVPRVTTSSDNGQAMVTMPYEVLMNADQPMVLLVQWETPRPDSASR
ncbi:MAG: hypothetical protein MK085_04545, partial [Phycisphaerales bacterium]|nr:hypothetical protein [Phycisphaerales bacterium]